MAFKSNSQRGAYFEQLKQKGMLGQQKPAMGLPPAQNMNQIAASPMAPPIGMPPKSNQPASVPSGLAPNPMNPMNPAGANKFGRLKRFM